MESKINHILKSFIANLLILFGLVQRARAKSLRGDHILSLYFHKPSKVEFERCLQWLIKNNFQFLSTTDLNNIIGGQLPFPKGAVVLTVDDGWQSNEQNIAGIANKYQVPVTIFISTDPVEKGTYWWSYVEEARKRKLTRLAVSNLKHIPNERRVALLNALQNKISLPREAMTIEQIERIAASPWVTIGGHTLSHPILPHCSSEQVHQELAISKQKLEAWTGRSIDSFAYPNGDYAEREIEILQQQGYKMAFTVRPEYLTPDRLRHKYELPRFEVIENAPFSETICRMMGVWEPLSLKAKSLFTGQEQLEAQHNPSGMENKKMA